MATSKGVPRPTTKGGPVRVAENVGARAKGEKKRKAQTLTMKVPAELVPVFRELIAIIAKHRLEARAPK